MNVLHVAVIGTGQGKSNKYSHVYQQFFFLLCTVDEIWICQLPL